MNKITRREFLEGASAAALVSSSARGAESLLAFRRDYDDVVVQIGGEDVWTIKPTLLAPTARAETSINPDKVRILGGKLPSGLGFAIDFDFEKLAGKWCVSANWHFPSIGVRTKSDPVGLARKAPVEFRAVIRGRELALLISKITGKMLYAPDKAVLHLDGASHVSLDAAPNQFSVLKKRLASQRLLLSPVPENMHVEFVSEMPATEIGLGSYKATQLMLRTPSKTKVGLGGGQLSLQGSLDLLVRNGKTDTAKIPCRTGVLTPKGPNSSWQLIPLGDFWRLVTPRASFEVDVDEDEDGDHKKSRRPIEVTATGGGTLTEFTADVRVHSSTIALAGVDRTRFDINGQTVRLILFDKPHKEPTAASPNPPPPTTFVLSDSDALLKLNLDKAALRLWRGRDLFCLTFRFSNINLVIGKRVELVPMKATEIKQGGATPEPVLVADFPPQHIMERTFLRQNRELPDAGTAATSADLRLLQQLEVSAGENRRKEIQAEKIDAENREIPVGDFHPFQKFAEAWDHAFKGIFGSWIGPAGLFTITARREARRFAEKRRQQSLTDLLTKASNGLLGDADFAEAPDVLGMPALSLSRAEARAWLKKPPLDDEKTLLDLDRLLNEAGRRDPDFARFQEKSRAVAKEPLILPTWPFSDQDRQDIFIPPPPSPPPPPPPAKQTISGEMQKVLHALLKEELDAQSDTDSEGGQLDRYPEGFHRPVEAWIAEPSRLAFAIKPDPIELTVEKLTAWENFELRVIQRAKRLYGLYGRPTEFDPKQQSPEADPATILRNQRILPNLGPGPSSGQDRMTAIRNTMVPPKEFETAIEIPTGLILSPAQDARWITPKTLPAEMAYWRDDMAPTAVWQARLVEKLNVPSLRAVWSHGLDPSFLEKGHPLPEKWSAPDDKEYRTAMSPQDRAELVALTSMYGLPVIASGDKDNSSQIAPPKEYKIDADGETAIFMPVPLQTRRLALGATGAMLDLDATFPAVTAARVNKQPLFDSFSIQRWRSLVSDGSDVVTTVVRQGYLFPLCHKASLIKVTEPRLRPIDPARPSLGYTVEQATRIFIEVTRASHHYPAVGQLNGGRSLQPHDVTLRTLRTPDLIDASDDKPLQDFGIGAKPEDIAAAVAAPLIAGQHGAIRGWVDQGDGLGGPVPGRLAGKVFWPRTEVGTKGTVRFRMRIDRGSAPVAMPLIFVDHTAASDPATMKALCTRYYNGGLGSDGDKPKDWNKVQHNGALRTYADELRQGQCTFATDWQQIKVEGGATSFNLDASLLAAEQPPFYPKMALAQIRPQQIQGLTGSGAPALQVAYACDYEKYGFNPLAELKIADPDTYLVVTNDPRPMLDMGNHGDQGGTVARKAMEICGLNRRFGLAGPPLRGCTMPAPAPSPAPAAPAPPPQKVAPAIIPLAASQPRKCDLSTEPEKKSYSKELALGHFGEDAKLFGLIKLSEFITLIAGEIDSDIIPKLEEVTNFTNGALDLVVEAILGPVSVLQLQLKKFAGDVVFPDFAAALGGLQCELTKVKNGSPLSEAQQIESSTKIWAVGQQVSRELEAIARTPVGDIAERLRAHLIRSQAQIVDALSGFTPWIPLQEKLAQLVADSAKLLPDAMVTVALPDSEARQLAQKVARAVAQPDVWRDHDPLSRIINAVKNDPAPPVIANLDQVVVKGVLYDLTADLLSILQEEIKTRFDPASVSAAVEWAEKAIKNAEELRNRIAKLADVTVSLCNKAVDAINEIFAAAVPDLDSRTIPIITSSAAEKAVAAIRKAAQDIREIRTKIDTNAGAFRLAVLPMLDYLETWTTNLDAFAGKLDVALKATATARKNVTDALGASASCTTFDIKVTRVVAALRFAQQNLVTVWLDTAAALPGSPPPPAPAGANATLLQLWQDVRDKIADVVITNVTEAMKSTLLNAASAGQVQWAQAKADLSELGGLFPDLALALSKAEDAIKDASGRLAGALQLPAPLPAGATAMHTLILSRVTAVRGIEKDLRDREAKLFDSVLRVAISRLLKMIEPNLDNYSKGVLGGIGLIYDQILTVRDNAYRTVTQQLGSDGLDLVVQLFGLPPTDLAVAGCKDDWGKYIFYVPLKDGGVCELDADGSVKADGLVKERAEISSGTTVTLTTLLGRWKNNEAAPQKIIKHVEYFAKFGVRAAILKVFDVEQLRQQITDALSLALPTTRTLKSNLSLPLSTTLLGLGTFRPTGNDKTLTLATTATINLLRPQVPQAAFLGKVTPFELDILSIMTFNFRGGVTYGKSPTESRGYVSAPLGAEDIKFGDKLSFLADLSRSLSFGGGDGTDGPYTILHVDSPSIEAGYRIGIPVITLGVTFTNIHFAGAVMLPFDKGSARLRAALGSLDAPFMISAGIYGGSGFMGIEASPHGIEAFEASFEFGGIASIGYGPLQGTAYVTTGAYVRKDGLGCTFAALFSAGFTAHIACFGISASFTLRLYKRAGDSSVQGVAQLTFTFSVGLAKVHYTIRVARTMQAGFGGGGQQAADNFLPGSHVQLAALGGFTPDCYPIEQAASLITESLSPADSWSAFEAQFDPQFYPRFTS